MKLNILVPDGDTMILREVHSATDELGQRVLEVLVQCCGMQLPDPLALMGNPNEQVRKAMKEGWFLGLSDAAGGILQAIEAKNAYIASEKKLLTDLQNRQPPEHAAPEQVMPKNLQKDLDQCLVSLKVALDGLARAVVAICGVSGPKAWHSKGGVSGQRIRNLIAGLPKRYADNNDAVLDFFDRYAPFLTELVSIRDSKVHPEQVKKILWATAHPDGEQYKVTPPLVEFEGRHIAVSELLSVGIDEVFRFVMTFAVLILHMKAGVGAATGPGRDMRIVANTNDTGEVVSLYWAIVNHGQRDEAQSS